MTQGRVSVVIPAYNAAHTLGRALDSVARQTLAPRQIIVVDDGSRDDLSKLKSKYPGVRWHHQQNQGAAAARNAGIHLASEPLVAFLDADDYWQPNKLEAQTTVFAEHPELGVCCSRFLERRPGENASIVRRHFRSSPQLDRLRRLNGSDVFDTACCVWTGTVMARTDLLRETPFESGLEPAEDRDLWIRLLQSAPSFFMSQALATAVLEPGSLSRTAIDRDCGNMLRVIERNRSLLGSRLERWWQARTYQRWAAEHLGNQQPLAAKQPARQRLRLEPWSAQAWWIVAKSNWLSAHHKPNSNAEQREPTRLPATSYREVG